MNSFINNRSLKHVSITCFLLLLFSFNILMSVQPIGYIVDIYSTLPFSYYICLILCYMLGIFLVFNGNKIMGSLVLCLNHIELLIIPYMLGYYSMGRADDMSYIGEYLQIATSGHFANWDIYPASHVIGSSISLISDLQVHQTSFIIPIIFSFMFIIGIILFSRQFIDNSCINSIVLVSSFILYLGPYNFLNVPHALFFSMIPMYLYCFTFCIKDSNNISFSIIFVLLTVVIPITHPFIVFFLFCIFLLYMISQKLLPNMCKVRESKTISSSFMLLIFSFTAWFIYNNGLMNQFKISYASFIQKITEPVFYETTEKLSKIDLDIFEFFKLVSFFYGRYYIPAIIIFISSIYILKNKMYIKYKYLKYFPHLLILYFIFLFIQVVLLFNPIISHQSDRVTNLNFTIYAQVPLFACSLFMIYFSKFHRVANFFIVMGILTIIWSLSLFGCFDSPNVYKTNIALTYNEVHGMDWFYQVKDDSIVSIPLSQVNRFHDLFGNPEKKDVIKVLPDHFGYLNGTESFADINMNRGEKSYIIILTIDELLYQQVPGYVNVERYTKKDYMIFRKDISVNKIYDSLNIEIYNLNSALLRG